MQINNQDEHKELLMRMRKTLDKLSEQVECNTCDLCEEGAVYILNLEVPLMKSLNVPLVNIDGSYFLEKKGRYCPAYNEKEKRCAIYSERPICCRLFPLDIFVKEEKLKWIVFDDCPIIKHKVEDGSLNCIIEIAKKFDTLITKEIADEFRREYDAWKKTGDTFLNTNNYRFIKDVEIK